MHRIRINTSRAHQALGQGLGVCDEVVEDPERGHRAPDAHPVEHVPEVAEVELDARLGVLPIKQRAEHLRKRRGGERRWLSRDEDPYVCRKTQNVRTMLWNSSWVFER